MYFDPELWTRSIREIFTILAGWLPRLAAALVWLILGWVVARLTQFMLAGALRRIGLDKLVERTGGSDFLVKAGFDAAASRVIARLIYWLVLLVFVLAATESMGLSRVVETMSGLVDFLPKLLIAVLILLFGGLLARVAGDTIGGLATQAGVNAGKLLGQFVRYGLFAFVAILALEQLQVQTTLLTVTAMAIAGAVALTLALSFGLGTRQLARNIMAGMHAHEIFKVGQRLRLGDITGRLVSIGTVKTVLETEPDSHLVSIPNRVLIDEQVTVITDSR